MAKCDGYTLFWNGATAYLDFWKRTGCTRIIKNASPKNVIIPEFDYYTGTRLVSISGRKKTNDIEDVFSSFYQHFILETEAVFPGLKKMADWEILYTACVRGFWNKNRIKNPQYYKKERQSFSQNVLSNS